VTARTNFGAEASLKLTLDDGDDTECIGMLMTCVFEKFHTSCTNSLLVIDIRRKVIYISLGRHVVVSHLQTLSLQKVLYLPKSIRYTTQFQDTTINGTSGSSTSEVRKTAMLIVLVRLIPLTGSKVIKRDRHTNLMII
jgi:hypothetical protein